MPEDLIGALRLDGDRMAVRLERRYGTDAADLWAALTDPARLSRWFARVDGDLRPDGTFCIYFDDEDPDERTVGQVRECEPPHWLVVTWHFRDEGGAYWTGCVHPECVRYPGGERSTYTAAAVLLADHALYGYGPSAGLFRGETLPSVVDVTGVTEPLGEG